MKKTIFIAIFIFFESTKSLFCSTGYERHDRQDSTVHTTMLCGNLRQIWKGRLESLATLHKSGNLQGFQERGNSNVYNNNHQSFMAVQVI